ncbi:FAD-dependent oxidoreductase [Isoptericola sp. S6320L]|uniref:FAD-dependent oxidoreductase n=1 Tax=Isoptericola sp. S6320L TaxID=2926411 RepID=UPI001FF46A82|nr:FAD-dependent oxidoreductase [Isoptericola sp. S6320L]MCK0116218.1 FAD-dependent oxidoreductase [Isoptericola sp. S6320L]
MTLHVPLKVVVVGHGMVGSRLVDELVRRSAESFDITVLGAEPYEPYNRVLLSDVVAGRTDVAAITMPDPGGDHVTTLRGVAAVSVDRRARTVTDAAGAVHGYDHLVLATGSRARVLPLPGLVDDDGAADLPAGVHALRTLDDAREIVAASVNTPRAVVVGGGVLGVEAAYGLAGRGLQVTLVDPSPAPMSRQLDTAAGAVLAARLRDAGVTLRLGARPSEVLVAGGRAVGVRLGPGHGGTGHDGGDADDVVAAGLVVLTAGTVPETGIAREAGLSTDRGIVVGHDLASPDDPRVFAIGDCAQPPQGSRGLVAEGWDQARRLADHLASLVAVRAQEAQRAATPREHLRFPHEGERPSMAVRLGTLLASRAATDQGVDTRGTDVVKVKAGALSIVSMGVSGPREPAPGHRAVALHDAAAGRYVEAVVADGILVGATCVGDPRVAADLTAAYTRRTPVPVDPAFLLLTPVMPSAEPASSPEHMPDDATVCRCNGVTKHDITACWDDGARSADDIAAATRATTGCGSCREAVCGLADWLAATRDGGAPVEPGAALVHASAGEG